LDTSLLVSLCSVRATGSTGNLNALTGQPLDSRSRNGGNLSSTNRESAPARHVIRRKPGQAPA
jgi:hypothetical protein